MQERVWALGGLAAVSVFLAAAPADALAPPAPPLSTPPLLTVAPPPASVPAVATGTVDDVIRTAVPVLSRVGVPDAPAARLPAAAAPPIAVAVPHDPPSRPPAAARVKPGAPLRADPHSSRALRIRSEPPREPSPHPTTMHASADARPAEVRGALDARSSSSSSTAWSTLGTAAISLVLWAALCGLAYAVRRLAIITWRDAAARRLVNAR